MQLHFIIHSSDVPAYNEKDVTVDAKFLEGFLKDKVGLRDFSVSHADGEIYDITSDDGQLTFSACMSPDVGKPDENRKFFTNAPETSRVDLYDSTVKKTDGRNGFMSFYLTSDRDFHLACRLLQSSSSLFLQASDGPSWIVADGRIGEMKPCFIKGNSIDGLTAAWEDINLQSGRIILDEMKKKGFSNTDIDAAHLALHSLPEKK